MTSGPERLLTWTLSGEAKAVLPGEGLKLLSEWLMWPADEQHGWAVVLCMALKPYRASTKLVCSPAEQLCKLQTSAPLLGHGQKRRPSEGAAR